ncbi:NADPH-dependent FMN reductase [[Clostridium] polysaccharolyticum]|uniref:NADPH-dependent FMN reductase n=2 Tax=[Clostridium] polysaccharolyticum TaxID=29364 RepID=A0A1I0D9R3_9FIRM|nr:SCP2 sterol-binding domain-containing protein [[Clostridium] polysaccharolyticum]SET29015.1 NADPH-dependent FMN reductase [[Clostridium] polysaccharolyticum]
MMKINIYYGGRGLIEDTTIYVMNKLTDVLEELRVEVNRYNLYEDKMNISVLPNTLKEADGVILATPVEWFGIGGYMQQFLDACWLYGDKEKIKKTYMFPLVMATTYGEREAQHTLIKSWEMLGGIALEGMCAYVEDNVEFETDPDYASAIENKAEMFYRAVNQKRKLFPSSMSEVKNSVLKNTNIDLTPQESEQLSKYVSDDTYVKQQKQDIEELTQMFKQMMGGTGEQVINEDVYISKLRISFQPMKDFEASYAIQLIDKNKILVIEIAGEQLKCYYGEKEDAEVFAKLTSELFGKIIEGSITFQKAFMSGELTAKGNFKTLRMFDTIFQFGDQ